MNKNIGQSRVIANYFTIKKYNENYYRLVQFKYPIKNYDDECFYEKSRDKNDEKMDNSISRSKSKIFEYALCNSFDFFVTLTLDRQKYDRYNLDSYIKALGQFIRNMRRDYGVNIQYLLIPECHIDGAWHIHGLIKDLPIEQLKAFKIDDKIPLRLKKMISEGREIYNWIKYADKFGWVTLERVKSQIAISKYITKYITKDMLDSQKTRKNKKLYYCSRGLDKAAIIKEGTMSANTAPALEFIKPFENDYLMIYDLNLEQYNRLFD